MFYRSCHLLVLALILSAGLSAPSPALPPVPPPVRLFDDPYVGVRVKALLMSYHKSVEEGSIKLAGARSAIRKAKQIGGGPTAAEKHAVGEYIAARKLIQERLRELGRFHAEMRPTASVGDLDSLAETIKDQWQFIGLTDDNTLELLQAVID